LKEFTDEENAQKARHAKLKRSSLAVPSVASRHAVASYQAAEGLFVVLSAGRHTLGEIFQSLYYFLRNLAHQGFFALLEPVHQLHLASNGNDGKLSGGQELYTVLQLHIQLQHQMMIPQSASDDNIVCTYDQPVTTQCLII
jgi:hypothetical protein